jgi:hypothetical protein
MVLTIASSTKTRLDSVDEIQYIEQSTCDSSELDAVERQVLYGR